MGDFRQWLDEVAIGIRRVRKAVQQEDGRLLKVPGVSVEDVQPLDIDRFMVGLGAMVSHCRFSLSDLT